MATVTNGCKIDFTNNTLVMNYKFHSASQEYGTPENNLVKEILKDFPSLTVVVKAGRDVKTTNKNKNLTYQNMRGHIQAVYGDTQKGKEALEMLDKVVALSKIQSNPYKYVRDWFVNEFPNYNSAASLYNCEELSDTFAATI